MRGFRVHMVSALEGKLREIPSQPGVYLMKGKAGSILYVGKARDLKKRVSSYIAVGKMHSPKVKSLVSKVSHIEYMLTQTEKEALILECNLIKRHKPKYNVVLKDDKNYLCLKLDVREDYPKLSVVRRIGKDGALYFGPYSSAKAVRETLKLIHEIFPIRQCKERDFRLRSRPCLLHQMNRCLAPCCLPVDPEEYKEMVDQVILLLQGKCHDLIKRLKLRMKQASDDLRFEEAARYRDKIHAVERTLEKQTIVSSHFMNQDIIGLYVDETGAMLAILFVRNGIMIGGRTFYFKKSPSRPNEVMSAFLKQFYGETKFIPDDILLSHQIEDQGALQEWLSEVKGRKVRIVAPRRGDKLRLVEMAMENARGGLKTRIDKKGKEVLKDLKERLSLNYVPRRIECFDISNISGSLAVGSMVVFEDGEPAKSGYRRFRIKTVATPDDYSMMEEVLRRRYSKVQNEDTPDLVLVDGGKGQLNIAVSILNMLMPERMPDVLGLAKDDRGPEKIFRRGRKNPIVLASNSPMLHLLQSVRDEAHRFAISYHKRLRRKEALKSVLDEIPGVGEGRKRLLLVNFGSTEALRKASLPQLAETLQNRKVAETVYNYLRTH